MPVAFPPALLLSALVLQLAGSPLAPRPESALPPELMPLLRTLKRHGFRVRIALPPARRAYGQYEPASRTLWLSPLSFELGIARQTFLHEAVHAAQSCPDGRVLRPIGWTLPLQPVVRNEISGLLLNAYGAHSRVLEQEAFALQGQPDAVPRLLRALEQRCGGRKASGAHIRNGTAAGQVKPLALAVPGLRQPS
jgi:hypothetical protein